MKIFSPIVDHFKLQIRLNLKTKDMELKVTLLALVTVYMSASRSVFCVQFVLWSVCPKKRIFNIDDPYERRLYICRPRTDLVLLV